jgi:hypothetical protein
MDIGIIILVIFGAIVIVPTIVLILDFIKERKLAKKLTKKRAEVKLSEDGSYFIDKNREVINNAIQKERTADASRITINGITIDGYKPSISNSSIESKQRDFKTRESEVNTGQKRTFRLSRSD